MKLLKFYDAVQRGPHPQPWIRGGIIFLFVSEGMHLTVKTVYEKYHDENPIPNIARIDGGLKAEGFHIVYGSPEEISKQIAAALNVEMPK
jgi:hypothetical protein